MLLLLFVKVLEQHQKIHISQQESLEGFLNHFIDLVVIANILPIARASAMQQRERMPTMKEVVNGRVWQGLGSGYDCNAFLIKGDQQTILVDSGTHSATEKVKEILSKFGVTAIVLTHGHLDHVGGAAHAIQTIRVPIWASQREAEKLETVDTNYIDPFFGTNIPPIEIGRRIEEGNLLDLGEITLKVLETPGHTSGSICLYEPSKQWLFSGDTVFADGSFGRTDLSTGSSSQLIDSLNRLSAHSVDSLFPGHMRSVITNGSKHIGKSYQNAKMWLF